MTATTLKPNEYLFIRWLSETHPALLAAAEKKVGNSAKLGAISDTISSLLSAVSSGLKAYTQDKKQADLIAANVARVQAGQPPLAANGQPYTASPAAAIMTAAPLGIPILVWIGLGLVGVYLLVRKSR